MSSRRSLVCRVSALRRFEIGISSQSKMMGTPTKANCPSVVLTAIDTLSGTPWRRWLVKSGFLAVLSVACDRGDRTNDDSELGSLSIPNASAAKVADCGDKRCGSAEVCVEHVGKIDSESFGCIADPCAPKPLDCACAKDLACASGRAEFCLKTSPGRVTCKSPTR
jgi:hypothetical protein